MKKNGFILVGTGSDGRWEPADLVCAERKKIALVFGAEADGISKSVLKRLDETVRIPMDGDVESLNVAVTASVLIFWLKLQKNCT